MPEPEPCDTAGDIDQEYLPFGTVLGGYNTVDPVKDLPDDVHLTEVETVGKRQCAAHMRELDSETYNAVKSQGHILAGSALLKGRKAKPQICTIGPAVTTDRLPHVAGTGRDVERAAISNRHFAKLNNRYGGLTGKVQEHVVEGITFVVDQVIGMLMDAGRSGQDTVEYPPDFDAEAKDVLKAEHGKKSTVLEDLQFARFKPGSWSDKGWNKQLFKSNCGTEVLRPRHEFFVKQNEALWKVKPRLIQSAGEVGTATHTMDAKLFETLAFGMTLLEQRSVKHATPKHLRARLANLLEPFLSGYAMSNDYGAFDSSNCIHKDDPRHSLKVLVENAVLQALFGSDADFSDVSRDALADRCKTALRSNSVFWVLYTKSHGRESGDSGTSCLNFIVNFVIFLWTMACEVGFRKKVKGDKYVPVAVENETGVFKNIPAAVISSEIDKDTVTDYLKGVPQGFDLLAEGDDGTWLFSKAFGNNSPRGLVGLADRITYWTSMAGLNLEPQNEQGTAIDDRRILKTTDRIEHCSRIIIPYKSKTQGGSKRQARPQSRIALLPKMRKTIEGADVSFGLPSGVEVDGMIESVAFTKFASCAFNSLDVPLLFEYFHMLARCVITKSHAPHFVYNPSDYTHRTIAEALLRAPPGVVRSERADSFSMAASEMLKTLRERHTYAVSPTGHVDAVRGAIRKECPLMDDDFIDSAAAGMAQAQTWDMCTVWSRSLKERLGAV